MPYTMVLKWEAPINYSLLHINMENVLVKHDALGPCNPNRFSRTGDRITSDRAIESPNAFQSAVFILGKCLSKGQTT